MSKVMYKSDASYVSCRAGVYYYTRRVPYDVRQHYASNRLSFSLRTKSNAGALRAAQSVTQRLEDYWLGLRLQDMDIPAIHLVKAYHVDDSSPLMLEAVENYLRIKGKDDRTFVRAAKRNGEYVVKALGNRPITSYDTSEFEGGMDVKIWKRRCQTSNTIHEPIPMSISSVWGICCTPIQQQTVNLLQFNWLHQVKH
jgi:hypothetical protein